MNKNNIYFGLLCLIITVSACGMKKEGMEEVSLFNEDGTISDEGATYKIVELLYQNNHSPYTTEQIFRALLSKGLNPNGRETWFAKSYLNMCIKGGSLELVKILLEDTRTEIWKEDVQLAQDRFLKAKTPEEKMKRGEIFKLVEARKYKDIELDTQARSNSENAIAESMQQLTLGDVNLPPTMDDTSSSWMN